MAPPGAPVIVSVEHDMERDATRLVIDVPAGATSLYIYRVGPSGTLAGVRGWYPGEVDGPETIVARDFEGPLGVTLRYGAVASNADGLGPAAETVEHEHPCEPGDDPWLIDLVRPSNSLPITVEGLTPFEYPVAVGVHRVLDRRSPVITSDIAGTPTFDLTFYTFDYPDGPAHVRDVLGNGVPCLLRTPPEQGVGNIYLDVLGWTEARVSRIAYEEARRYTVQCAQVARPDPGLYVPQPPSTYATVEAAYPTYAALLAARGTYDGVLYDYGTGEQAPTEPWLPADV